MVIYGDERSGNCLKVKYTADALGLGYDWHAIDIMAGESRSTEFLAQNPQGQVPVVVLASGEILAQSNAIIRYLANGSALLPARPLAQAKVDDWLFWEQYSHEPYVAVCRFQMLYQSLSADQREPERVRRVEAALAFMDSQLHDHAWLDRTAFSIADIALLAYTRLAHEGGFDLSCYAARQDWVGRCERQLGLSAN